MSFTSAPSRCLDGDTQWNRVTWQDKATGECSPHDIRHVFIMAGASPRTEWARGLHGAGPKGFILPAAIID